jgi:hypothetical protein
MVGRRIVRTEYDGPNSDGGREGCAGRVGAVTKVEDGVAWIAWEGGRVESTVFVSCIDRVEDPNRPQP